VHINYAVNNPKIEASNVWESSMLMPLKNLNSQLMSEGTVIVKKDEIPFTPSDWKTLATILDNLEYEDIYEGDTDESTSVKVFRVKKEKDPIIYHPQLMALLNSPTMKKYISNILNIDDYLIERCQCHVYHEGDFVSKHQDSVSCKEYRFAFMILLDGQYDGGEFCVYKPNENTPPHTYRPPEYSMIITKCNLPHEVKKITRGERKVIVGFLTFPSLATH
jgi:Rps23 Pro-64 3,4-dihydroxylase Tpa1-like proline 4-hydroxylase